MSAIAALIVNNLPLTRGGRLIQAEINLSIAAGEIVAVHGPNGAGKTSLLRAIAGLLEVPQGSVIFRMEPDETVANAEERLSRTGWFGHLDGVKRQLSLTENLRFFRRYNRSSEEVEAALDAVGLGQLRDLPAQFLSHGQRRRLAFARLLVVPRSLWLLDEPMASMDEKGKACVREQIRDHCGRGGIVVAASHESLGLEGASVELQ
ncbi:MAG TPA: heme ABC exporter ATP-binding protein CcmA [Rhizomicrobium sp.]|nr:heme ABC exporter ATP-binding protein CcmA [Rhizomicrobium sp.]